MRGLVVRVVVLAVLLWGGTALAAKGLVVEGLSKGASSMGISSLWKKHVPALFVAGGLLLGAYQLPALADHHGEEAEHQVEEGDHHGEEADHHGEEADHHGEEAEHHGEEAEHHGEEADHHGEEEPQVWLEHMTHETHEAVFYLSTGQKGNPTIRHVLYIGETDEGEHLFAGLYMYFLEPHQGNLRFYASNGQLLAEGASRVDVKVFPDPFNDFNVVNLFTIEGLELKVIPTPIVAEPYPIDEFGKELNMVAYLANPDDPDGVFNLVRRQRDCQVVDPEGWINVGVGMSSCAPPPDIGHSLNGAPIFDPDSGRLLAFYGEKVKGVHVALQNAEFVEHSSGQPTVVTDVSSKGKLSTMWAAIKAKR